MVSGLRRSGPVSSPAAAFAAAAAAAAAAGLTLTTEEPTVVAGRTARPTATGSARGPRARASTQAPGTSDSRSAAYTHGQGEHSDDDVMAQPLQSFLGETDSTDAG
ncbi:uncharacterized protein LOC143017968 [Oratosquilla oratoria]|uniref:uncharacterized protein LOC143017968 n=1 Tax=Oratosquilla oratoria TaxID=337810 RepID=UPI003F76B6CF